MLNISRRAFVRASSLAALCAATLSLTAAAQAAPLQTIVVTLTDTSKGLTAVATLTGVDSNNDTVISGQFGQPNNEFVSAGFSLYDHGVKFYSYTDVKNGVILNPDFFVQAIPSLDYINAFYQGNNSAGQPSLAYNSYGTLQLFALYQNVPNGFGSGSFDQVTVTVPEPGAIAFGVVSALGVAGLIARRRASRRA